MNKTELIAAVAEQAELSKKDAEKALKAFTDVREETRLQVRRSQSQLPRTRNSKLVRL